MHSPGKIPAGQVVRNLMEEGRVPCCFCFVFLKISLFEEERASEQVGRGVKGENLPANSPLSAEPDP